MTFLNWLCQFLSILYSKDLKELLKYQLFRNRKQTRGTRQMSSLTYHSTREASVNGRQRLELPLWAKHGCQANQLNVHTWHCCIDFSFFDMNILFGSSFHFISYKSEISLHWMYLIISEFASPLYSSSGVCSFLWSHDSVDYFSWCETLKASCIIK